MSTLEKTGLLGFPRFRGKSGSVQIDYYNWAMWAEHLQIAFAQ
jgi:hypothetical protein